MPISDEALQSPKNNFIAVKGEATVGQAIAALQGEGGQPWWHLVVRMDDGSEHEFRPGDAGIIPPGHDAWVVGDEPVVFIDFQGAGVYAKPRS